MFSDRLNRAFLKHLSFKQRRKYLRSLVKQAKIFRRIYGLTPEDMSKKKLALRRPALENRKKISLKLVNMRKVLKTNKKLLKISKRKLKNKTSCSLLNKKPLKKKRKKIKKFKRVFKSKKYVKN